MPSDIDPATSTGRGRKDKEMQQENAINAGSTAMPKVPYRVLTELSEQEAGAVLEKQIEG